MAQTDSTDGTGVRQDEKEPHLQRQFLCEWKTYDQEFWSVYLSGLLGKITVWQIKDV